VSAAVEIPALTSLEPLDPLLWPLTLEIVEAMVREGIISEKETVYLWKGRLARRMPPKPNHSLVVTLVNDALRTAVSKSWHVRQEQPLAVRLSPSAPQPDFMILWGAARDDRGNHPTTADAALAVEVSDSSLTADRRMAADYAAEGIPSYWIVDVVAGRIEVHSQPEGGTYRSVGMSEKGVTIPLVIQGQIQGEIPVSDLLP
jgi:Uma2 family endonuclease